MEKVRKGKGIAEDVVEKLMGVNPLPHEDVYRWINSDYHFEKKDEAEL